MKLTFIHHIAIIVSDLVRAKGFYINKLKFSIKRETYRPEKNDCKLDLDVETGIALEIFAVEKPPMRLSYPEAAGLRHLAFCVPNVQKTATELK